MPVTYVISDHDLMLEMLAQKGEDETFSYIKKELLTKKGY